LDGGVQLTTETAARLRTMCDPVIAVTGLVARAAATGKTAQRGILSPEHAAWLHPTGLTANAVAAAGRVINALALRWGFRPQADGTQRLPVQGSFVVAPKHASELDAFVIAAALPARLFGRSYWAGDDQRMLFTAPMRLLSRLAHVFPVDERMPLAAIVAAATLLARGDIVIWFPEGWVSPDGRLQRFRRGIGKLLTEVPVPVVPVYIRGKHEAMPRGKHWPQRRPVLIVFGDPVTADALHLLGTGESREERIAVALRDKVAALARGIGAEP
jgi:long-chain acyl-CoA synthetase